VAALVNGVFGDPLLHVRQRHGKRSLLFDLGEAGRLQARAIHEVTDVFVSHAHVDHVAGFLWFLRSRIGEYPACRVYGPSGLAANIAGLVSGVHWDRVGERGPRFEVAELHDGERVACYAVTTGEAGARLLGERTAPDGVLLSDPLLCVRAALLDHRTPVLAFALESAVEVKVRKERLAALDTTPGPWLTALKREIVRQNFDAVVTLPDGTSRGVRDLAEALVMVRPGEKLVYATDLADTTDNRQRLALLARRAHTFFCEATFCEADAERAARTGHLTARACGEIAAAAGVERLVPFHFSRRYASDPACVYREVRAACSQTVVPRSLVGV
jgi:ribonuclease BN (tRNA processing enzyme)